MNNKYLLNANELAKYNAGEIATAVNTETYKVIKVQQINGKMCQVISKSTPYGKVNPFINKPNELNLTAKETADAMKQQTIIVYRSSGIKNEDGRTLTRAEQKEQDSARTIEVVAMLKDKAHKDSVNPLDYDWHILNDNGNIYEELE